ncbi:MAG: hypothetical protein ACW991_08380, partial [Candidatus Hodarchaeales archaeon]
REGEEQIPPESKKGEKREAGTTEEELGEEGGEFKDIPELPPVEEGEGEDLPPTEIRQGGRGDPERVEPEPEPVEASRPSRPPTGEMRRFGGEDVEGDEDVRPSEGRQVSGREIGSGLRGTVAQGRQMLSEAQSGAERIASRFRGLRESLPTETPSLPTARGTLGGFGQRALSSFTDRSLPTTSFDNSALTSRFGSGLGSALRESMLSRFASGSSGVGMSAAETGIGATIGETGEIGELALL